MIIKKAIYVLSLVLVAGCSNVRVSTDSSSSYDPQKSFSFSWMEMTNQQQTKDSILDSSLMDKRIRAEIDRYLTANGKVKKSDTADYLIGYQLTIGEGLSVYRDTAQPSAHSNFRPLHHAVDRRFMSHFWPRETPISSPRRSSRKLVTLTIDVSDSNSKDLLWRGKGVKPLPRSFGKEELDAITQALVSKTLWSFAVVAD
jgi:hypothetical protein